MMKQLHIALTSRDNLNGAIFLSLFGFFIAFNLLLNPDFGAYEKDWIFAHGKSVELFRSLDIISAYAAMNMSASGAVAFYLFSFFPSGIESYLNLLFLAVLFVILYKLRNLPAAVFISFSPTLHSAVAYGAPEVLSFLLLGILMLLKPTGVDCPGGRSATPFRLLKGVGFCAIFFALALNRITFAVFYILADFLFENRITLRARFFISGLILLVTLAIMEYYWGGLVPEAIAHRHLTPSIAPFFYSVMIIGMYITPLLFSKYLQADHWSNRYLFIVTTISVLGCVGTYSAPHLLGGGYIFSRILEISPALVSIFGGVSIYLVCTRLDLRVTLFVLLGSSVFCTTSYLFHKYVEHLIIILLLTMNDQFRAQSFTKSIMLTQPFFLFIALIYY